MRSVTRWRTSTLKNRRQPSLSTYPSFRRGCWGCTERPDAQRGISQTYMITRKCLPLEQDFVALAYGPVERSHQQVQVDSQRVGDGHFFRQSTDKATGLFGREIGHRLPRLQRRLFEFGEMACHDDGGPRLELCLDVSRRAFRLQTERVAAEVYPIPLGGDITSTTSRTLGF